MFVSRTFWKRLASRTLSCHCLWTLSHPVGGFPAVPRAGPWSVHHPQHPQVRSETQRQMSMLAEEVKMTKDAEAIVRAAIQAVDPVTAVQTSVVVEGDELIVNGEKSYDLSSYDEIILVAFGKASSAMASAVLERLKERSRDKVKGLVICKDDHATPDEVATLESHRVSVRYASHPVPDQRSVNSSRELLELVRSGEGNDRRLVVACISGGGSALFCSPARGLTLDDLQQTNKALLQSGWSIQDMNVVRKRLEDGKGGRLAAAASCDVLSLILSDVLGDPLDLIASGPTVADTSTRSDAWELVRTLDDPRVLPPSVIKLLESGEGLEESPDQDHPAFAKCYNCLVGNNAVAVQAAAMTSKTLGYHPIVLGNQLEGEAREVARMLVSLAQHACQGAVSEFSLVQSLPAALIVGGETTVTIPRDNSGKGGRNQELALQAAVLLQKLGLRKVVVASVGTDGTDGPTDAAGAIVDGGTIDRLEGNAAMALRSHDAYPYLSQTDMSGRSPLLKASVTKFSPSRADSLSHHGFIVHSVDRSNRYKCSGRIRCADPFARLSAADTPCRVTVTQLRPGNLQLRTCANLQQQLCMP